MPEYTIDQIKAMSQEELHEANRQLGGKVLRRYMSIMALKWAVIFLAARMARKALTKDPT